MAEIVRLDRAAHRPVAGDTALVEAIQLAARSHQDLVWERTRHVLRLRSALREFYPAALVALPELDSPDALELLGKAPDPDTGARFSRRTIAAVYARANRRDPAARAEKTWRILRADELRQPAPVQASFAAITTSEAAIIAALNQQIEALGRVVADHFGQHPAAEILTSLPGLGVILGPDCWASSATPLADTSTPSPARPTPAPRRPADPCARDGPGRRIGPDGRCRLRRPRRVAGALRRGHCVHHRRPDRTLAVSQRCGGAPRRPATVEPLQRYVVVSVVLARAEDLRGREDRCRT